MKEVRETGESSFGHNVRGGHGGHPEGSKMTCTKKREKKQEKIREDLLDPSMNVLYVMYALDRHQRSCVHG